MTLSSQFCLKLVKRKMFGAFQFEISFQPCLFSRPLKRFFNYVSDLCLKIENFVLTAAQRFFKILLLFYILKYEKLCNLLCTKKNG